MGAGERAISPAHTWKCGLGDDGPLDCRLPDGWIVHRVVALGAVVGSLYTAAIAVPLAALARSRIRRRRLAFAVAAVASAAFPTAGMRWLVEQYCADVHAFLYPQLAIAALVAGSILERLTRPRRALPIAIANTPL